MKYSPEVYAGALIALAALRDKATERETGTIDFIAEAIAEKGDRDKLLSAPAADVVPVVHGHWAEIPNMYVCVAGDKPYSGHATSCSVCHEVNPCSLKTNYCSCCGALMDGKDEDTGLTPEKVKDIKRKQLIQDTGYKCLVCKRRKFCFMPMVPPLCGLVYDHFAEAEAADGKDDGND
jgi:hypothetical protein